MSRLPKRPRQHTLEELSERFVKGILPPEWIVERFEHDYGLDLLVEIVRGESVTGAHFTIQLKSTDRLVIRKDGYVAHSCETSTLKYFLERPELVIYLVYDAQNQVGYWLWIQDYIRQALDPAWKAQKSVTIRIPVENLFTSQASPQIEKRVIEAHQLATLLAAVRNAENEHYSFSIATGNRTADLGKQGAVIGASIEINGQVVTIGVHPKHPNALKDAPVQVQGTFWFDESPEGQEARSLLDRTFKAGETARLSAPFFEGFGLPKVLESVFAQFHKFDIHTIELLPIVPDEQFNVKVSVLDASGKDIAEIPYIEFRTVRRGTEEVTHSNEHQRIPLKFRFIYNYPKESASIEVSMHLKGENVFQVRNFLHTQQAIAHASALKFTNLYTGQSIVQSCSTSPVPEVDDQLISIIDDLVFIQEKTQQSFVWPGELNEDEVLRLKEIAIILRTGRLRKKASQFTVPLPKSMIQELASSRAPGERFQLLLDSGGTAAVLLGVHLDLGPCRVVLPDAQWSADSAKLLGELAEVPDDTPVEITLDVGEPGILHLFSRWQQQA